MARGRSRAGGSQVRRWLRRRRSRAGCTRSLARREVPCTARRRTRLRPGSPPAESKRSLLSPPSRRRVRATPCAVPGPAGLAATPAGASPALAAAPHPAFEEPPARAPALGEWGRDCAQGLPPSPQFAVVRDEPRLTVGLVNLRV